MISSRCSACLWWIASTIRSPVFWRLRLLSEALPGSILQNGHYYGGWPLTDQNDLCGEFKPDAER